MSVLGAALGLLGGLGEAIAAQSITSLTLTFHEPTPSQNETQGLAWPGVQRMRNRWHALLLEALSDQHLLHLRPGRRKACVHITRIGKGTLDYGNLVGGCKVLIDRLVNLGLIVDDSPQWLTESYDQRRCAKGEKPRTVVRIEWDT